MGVAVAVAAEEEASEVEGSFVLDPLVHRDDIKGQNGTKGRREGGAGVPLDEPFVVVYHEVTLQS
jgi:hypothetical protein